MQGKLQSYWERLFADAAGLADADPAVQQAIIERITTYLGRTDHVLELGGGDGALALRIARHVARYELTDADADVIAAAQANLQHSCPNHITATVAEIGDSQLPRGVDVVLAMDVLHLLPDLPAALRHMSALLRPGGYFISRTQTFQGPEHLWRLPQRVRQAMGRAPAINAVSPPTLERMIKSAGFEIVSCEKVPRGSRAVMCVARRR